MDPELIRLLKEASSKLTETESILNLTQKALDVLTIPAEQLTILVQRYRTVKENFENQKLKIFITLVNITLLLPTARFSGHLEANTTSDSVCIEPLSELKIKVYKPIHYNVRLMTPENFVKNYPSLWFSESLIYQIREAVSNLKKVGDNTQILHKVAKLYQELASELVDI